MVSSSTQPISVPPTVPSTSILQYNSIGNSSKANDDKEILSVSDDDDEGSDSFDILADLDEPPDAASTLATAEGGQAEDAIRTLSTFRREQEDLHAQSSHSAPKAAIPLPSDNLDLAMCFVCGASLSHIRSGYKGRLQHIKRCSKKRGVSAKDVRAEDDVEEDTLMSPPALSKKPATSGAMLRRNPYARTNEWHGKGDGLLSRETETTKAAPTSFDLLMAGAKRASKTEQIKKQRKKSRGGGGSSFRTYNSASCPKYKKIPGTDFVCDGFQYAGPETKNYFLTHFHSDHYGGISKSWTKGIIYCSFATANLVHEQLGVPRDFLHPLPMHIPTVIESCGKPITVTLVDANHCPGAIMFLFEVGKRTILHVGDFRWNLEHMSRQAPLQPFCRTPWTQGTSQRHLDDLFLDTTYCDPKYCLPSQAECIKAVVQLASDEIRKAQEQRKRLLMLFGAYTIGKEAVYMAVAKHLGAKVYVERRRHKVLAALQWPADEMAMFTTNPQESMLWVVPLGHINMKKMPPYQSIRRKGFSRDYDRVVGFRPTGWSMPNPSKRKDKSIIGSTHNGSLTVHSVPYSEHSSFPELLECLETLNPRRIIPTVGASTSQQQVDLLITCWRDKQAKLF